MLQFFLPISTFGLAFSAVCWNRAGATNALIRVAYTVAAVVGAIASAKVLVL